MTIRANGEAEVRRRVPRGGAEGPTRSADQATQDDQGGRTASDRSRQLWARGLQTQWETTRVLRLRAGPLRALREQRPLSEPRRTEALRQRQRHTPFLCERSDFRSSRDEDREVAHRGDR